MGGVSYYCDNCKKAVIVVKGEAPVKACKCENAPIIANMTANVIRNTGGIRV